MTTRSPALLVCLALLAAPAAADAPATIAGTWRLVEQRYERGGRNFAPPDGPARLVITPRGTRWEITIEIHGQRGEWPLYPSPAGPRPLTGVRVHVGPLGRELAARYVVRPAPGDDTYLHVTESYRLDGRGRLVGTMSLRFVRGGKEHGGFAWHRVFERESG